MFIERIAMATKPARSLATIQWDVALDEIETIIRKQKCLCCRAAAYYNTIHEIHSNEILRAAVPEFGDVYAAYSNLMDTVDGLFSMKIKCYKQNHGYDKPFLRELARAETNLVVLLHYHPLLRDYHVCFMSFPTAAYYGVELAACDDVFMTSVVLAYLSNLVYVRNLFE
jgi:hypothetical protein